MVLAPELPDGRTAVLPVPCVLPPGIAITRPFVTGKKRTAQFQAEAYKLLASGKIKGTVSSHIPSVPALTHTEAHMVRTAKTAPVMVVLDARDAAGGLSLAHRGPRSSTFITRGYTTLIGLRRFVVPEGALAASSFIANPHQTPQACTRSVPRGMRPDLESSHPRVAPEWQRRQHPGAKAHTARK